MKPAYTIRQLMYNKYGEDRFELACGIVSLWLKFEMKDERYTAEWVQRVCNTSDEFRSRHKVLTDAEALALRRFFGYKITEGLVTKK